MYLNDTHTGNVIRKSDNKVVAPVSDPTDQDYVDYVTWVNEGNIPEDFSSYEQSGQALKDEKLKMWELIKQERERRQYDAVLVEGNWFHSDLDSRIKYEKFINMGSSLPPTPWKVKSPGGGLFDPVFVTMTPALLGKIATAMTMAEINIFAAAENHRVAMLKAPVPSDYDYLSDWPVSFTDTYPDRA
jgi:hypothetical protein